MYIYHAQFANGNGRCVSSSDVQNVNMCIVHGYILCRYYRTVKDTDAFSNDALRTNRETIKPH